MINGSWVCPICENTVDDEIYPCPFCQAIKLSPACCQLCTFSNEDNAIECQACGHLLKEIQEVPESYLICLKCQAKNLIQLEECLYCGVPLHDSLIECELCQANVLKSNHFRHQEHCRLTLNLLAEEENNQKEDIRKMMQENEKYQKETQQLQFMNSWKECVHCGQHFNQANLTAHANNCELKGKANINYTEKKRLTLLQRQAIDFMYVISEKEHIAAQKGLQERFEKLKFRLQDLDNLRYYVQNYAPIIIHIHISKYMEFFIRDTHYRSQFETNKSSGSLSRPSRIQWQDRMFSKKYSKAKDSERVKYGVINFTNDPKGVSSCVSYGLSYFLLKEHVRQRCTFTDKDSSGSDASIATFKYCYRVVSKMSDAELKAAVAAARANQVQSNCSPTYKEIQIHGPIEFNQDIECLYVNNTEIKANPKLIAIVKQFSLLNSVKYEIF